MRLLPTLLLFCGSLAMGVHAQGQGFKFPVDGAPEPPPAEQLERQARTQSQLATPCRDRIRNRKIMVLIGEERNGAISARQGAYSRHVETINARLQALGLKTYTSEQIRRQTAQAEIDAYFKNDPDAALGAARRMAAQYILRGLIASRAERNAIVNVNQVYISMHFTLTEASGKHVSTATARDASYAGSDTSGMALTLVEENADEVVARLYSDYCRSAGGR